MKDFTLDQPIRNSFGTFLFKPEYFENKLELEKEAIQFATEKYAYDNPLLDFEDIAILIFDPVVVETDKESR